MLLLYTKLKALTGIGLNEYINKNQDGKAFADYCYRFYIYGYFRESKDLLLSVISVQAFKQYTGETPTAYRSRQKKKE